MLSKHVSKLLKLRKDKKKSSYQNIYKDVEHDRNSEKSLSKVHRNKKEQSSSNSSNQLGCFKCGKQGHVKAECPKLKRERALQATWSCSEDESSDSDDEQHVTDELTEDIIPLTNQVCYQANTVRDNWILDSGCSHHMT
ncbi:hypothetical protein LINPERPRIM_LOCUS35161, partial [Linum perenne]